MGNYRHTPGPWSVVDRDGYGIHFDIEGHPDYRFGGPYKVAQVDGWLTHPYVTAANAKLVASAPIMLDALEALVRARYLYTTPDPDAKPGTVEHLYQQAIIAIKAAGGTAQTEP